MRNTLHSYKVPIYYFAYFVSELQFENVVKLQIFSYKIKHFKFNFFCNGYVYLGILTFVQ